MLTYFDESTQDHETVPTSAVSALTATGKDWSRFSREWLGILEDKEFDVRDEKGRRIFHANTFETPEGRAGTVYENWDDDKRKRFNKKLCDAIANNGIQVSAACVIVADYEEVGSKRVWTVNDAGQRVEVERSKLFGDRYAFCAYWAMVHAVDEAKPYYPKSTEMAYYFEGGSTYRHFVGLYYDVATAKGNYFRFFDKPNFVCKDFNAALQAADKMAYEASKHLSHSHHPNPPKKYVDESGKWKTRYTLGHLVTNGVDVNIRYWLKEDLEEFFATGEKSAAKRAGSHPS